MDLKGAFTLMSVRVEDAKLFGVERPAGAVIHPLGLREEWGGVGPSPPGVGSVLGGGVEKRDSCSRVRRFTPWVSAKRGAAWVRPHQAWAQS
jgi:hypothetical protein